MVEPNVLRDVAAAARHNGAASVEVRERATPVSIPSETHIGVAVDGARIRNALTVDVEDYFQVSAFEKHIPKSHWDRMPCRIERNIEAILSMFAGHGVQGTFFTLGWIAVRYPAIVRKIVDAGHELASHGFSHGRASEQSRDEFSEDVVTAKKMLEDIAGVAVRGYRAPSFSIGPTNLWALESLAKAGYTYSSSIYPVRHDHYGLPDAPRFNFRPEHAPDILEIPVTTVRMWNHNLPAGGGGYFRLMPYSVSRWCLRRVNHHDRQPCVFYFHPWELDPEQPRQVGISTKTRFRHYVNLARMRSRIERLLRDFEWGRMDHIFLTASP